MGGAPPASHPWRSILPAAPTSRFGRSSGAWLLARLGPTGGSRGTEKGVWAGQGVGGVDRGALLAVEGDWGEGAAPHLPSWVPAESPFRC